MSIKNYLSELYESDQDEWRIRLINLINEGHISDIDFINLKVFLIEMGSSDYAEIESRMSLLMMHLLKAIYQPKRMGKSWVLTIIEQRRKLKTKVLKSKNFENHLRREFKNLYLEARQDASLETRIPIEEFPKEPPFTFDEVLESGYIPNAELYNVERT